MKFFNTIKLVILCIALTLVGCSGPNITYNKPGATVQEFNRDKYECVQQSRTSWSAGGTGLAGSMMIVGAQTSAKNQSDQLFRMCMEARGYTASEVNEEEVAKRKDWIRQWNEVAIDSQNICSKTEYQLLYKKSPCLIPSITLEQLTDKTYLTDDQKPVFLKENSENKSIATRRNELTRTSFNMKLRELGNVNVECDIRIDKNTLNLYEGKITWGEYNKIRKEIGEYYSAEYKRINSDK